MEIGFQRIHPTPNYPVGLNGAGLAAFSWTSRAQDVVLFKTSLKGDLRELQLGRCCYCRRMLSDPMATDLEHFVEKSAYPLFTFEILNLALSCGTCNSKKNDSFMSLSRYLSRRASAASTSMTVRRCPTLVTSPPLLAPLPTNPAAYRWVHPHLDNFSDHITIQKSWVFTWHSNKGFRTIRGMQLNALAQIERRALSERLASRKGALSLLVGALAELNHATGKQVGALVSAELRRRRAASVTGS